MSKHWQLLLSTLCFAFVGMRHETGIRRISSSAPLSLAQKKTAYMVTCSESLRNYYFIPETTICVVSPDRAPQYSMCGSPRYLVLINQLHLHCQSHSSCKNQTFVNRTVPTGSFVCQSRSSLQYLQFANRSPHHQS